MSAGSNRGERNDDSDVKVQKSQTKGMTGNVQWLSASQETKVGDQLEQYSEEGQERMTLHPARKDSDDENHHHGR